MVTRDFLQRGRVAQKRRTRQALLDAGIRVLERGEEPTLERVAAEADVSRVTAYRYFPRIESLVSVLTLAGLVAPTRTILAGAEDATAEAQALAVHRYFYRLAVENESAFRHLIRAVVDEQLREGGEPGYEPVRGGFRLRSFSEALAPLDGRIPEPTLDHLRTALVALSGIEALMTVKDVLGLEPAEGARALEWAARTLLRAAVQESR